MPKKPSASKKPPQSKKPAKKRSVKKTTSKKQNGSTSAKKAAPKRAKKSKSSKAETEREILYPKVEARVCQGDKRLTPALAKELLGWVEESETLKFGKALAYHFKTPKYPDVAQIKVRCNNNVTNRPIYMNVVQRLMQDVLRKRWYLNGEPIIIGETGLVLNGQHTLIALCFAELELKHQGGKWIELWGEEQEPYIEKLLVRGISEADEVVNTMDTAKPRSLADVLYRSPIFAKKADRVRRKAARNLDHATRILWHRTGTGFAFSLRRTHSESVNFIQRHPHLVDAVGHIMEEDGADKRIRRFLAPGYSAGLMYLMGTCGSVGDTDEGDGYFQTSEPNENQLDFEAWELARDFFTKLAAGDKKMNPVRTALGKAVEEGGQGIRERSAILVKAWNLFSSNKKMTVDALMPEYTETDRGTKCEVPTVGGIDIGEPQLAEE